MIYKQEVFINDAGVIIHARTPVPGRRDAGDAMVFDLVKFHAVGVLKFQLPDGQTGEAQFQFDIPGVSIEEAFENFPAAFEAARQRAEHDLRAQLAQQQQRIIVPGHPVPGNGRIH